MSRNKYPEITVNRILNSATKLFLEKGYDKTTIQDIVNDLGDLSKGAIYHHFSSKEEIIEAVSARMMDSNFQIDACFHGQENGLNGLEKLQEIILSSLNNAQQREWMKAIPDFFDNPKFLLRELHESVKTTAPCLVPYIEEGIADGSITTEYPLEAAEVLMMLSNVWINPLIFKENKEEFTRKVYFLKSLLERVGLPVMDERVMESTLAYKDLLAD